MSYKVGNLEFRGDEKLVDVVSRLNRKEQFEELKKETWRQQTENDQTNSAREIVDRAGGYDDK